MRMVKGDIMYQRAVNEIKQATGLDDAAAEDLLDTTGGSMSAIAYHRREAKRDQLDELGARSIVTLQTATGQVLETQMLCNATAETVYKLMTGAAAEGVGHVNLFDVINGGDTLVPMMSILLVADINVGIDHVIDSIDFPHWMGIR